LSGGQKQRVAIARAIITNPNIIFADEPTGNLDSVTGKKVEDLLFKLNEDRNITLVVVTHDKDLSSKCEREIVLKDGKIISDKNLQ
jgi:putative ABC transport system ATP-binding protein